MADKKPKYDPNAKYTAKKRIKHPVTGYVNADSKTTFTMGHLSPEQVEFLVDHIKAIAPAS